MPTHWTPFSGLFSRSFTPIDSVLRSPLPTLPEIARTRMPQRILDIGCGLGVALLDAIARLQSLQIDAEGEDVCALGLTNLRYSAMIFNDTRTAVPGREEAQRKGLQALFEPGTLARENVAALVQRYQLNATLPWRRLLPTVFDGDYNRGLPVQTETVDFIFEQGSLKWDDHAAATPRGGNRGLRSLLLRRGCSRAGEWRERCPECRANAAGRL